MVLNLSFQRAKPLASRHLSEQNGQVLILDTNVISELMRPKPRARVSRWVAGQPGGSLFITTVTEAELRYGIALLPQGKRRRVLSTALEEMFDQDFSQRILSFDRDAAIAYASIVVRRRQLGRPIAQFDAQIAAVTRSRNAVVATRNATDFLDCGIEVINPWKD